MKLLKILLLSLSATFATANAAVVVVTDTSAVTTIPGLTGFSTSGAQMDGLKVTANFTGFSQTLSWADTSADSGGVTGDGWSLGVSGNTYSAAWQFNIMAGRGALQSLVLDASGPQQVTVFDTFFGGAEGTPDSASGKSFQFSSCSGCDATARYSNAVAIAPAAPVGDLFHTLAVNFANGGRTGSFSFFQDTDNDARLTTGFVPEPGSLPLFGLALLAIGAVVRRRRA